MTRVLTNDVSREVVLSVDLIASLLAVTVDDDHLEVLREELCVGPQVQLEMPGERVWWSVINGTVP